jgi:hypothetical protein
VAGNQDVTQYLELGHMTLSEKTMPFTQYLVDFLEIKFETDVKAKLLTIYLLSLSTESFNQMICIDLA